MKKTPFYLISCTFLVLILFVVTSCSNVSDIDSGKVRIALREAGNQLLLKQQDSTSIILPIVEIKTNTYRLEVQNPLSFEPNELVTVIDSSFNTAGLSQNYRVEVIQCTNRQVAYSYEMHIEEERTIIPCAGRILPKACYEIEVLFLEGFTTQLKKSPILYALIFGFSMWLLYIYWRKFKSSSVSEEDISPFSKIGSFEFYPEQNKLVKAATEISLSKKECELLEIFVEHPNQIIKRDELTKKVWEDNGVFVGRSLDTYISKLRKKLQDDERIKITNVHGVGYKLEIS